MNVKIPFGGFIIGVALCAGIAVILLVRNRPEFVRDSPVNSGTMKSPVIAPVPTKENVVPELNDHIALLRKSVEDEPKNAAHVKALAILLMDSHKPGEAIPYFEQALRLQPKNDSLLLDLSVCFFNEKMYAKALETTERILVRDESHPRALYNKGIILAIQGKWAQSVMVWKRLLSVAPASDEAQRVRSEFNLMEKGQ